MKTHKTNIRLICDNESERKIKKGKIDASTSQTLISIYTTTKQSVNKYDRNNLMAKGFIQRFVRLVSTTSVPISIVEKQEFQELICL